MSELDADLYGGMSTLNVRKLFSFISLLSRSLRKRRDRIFDFSRKRRTIQSRSVSFIGSTPSSTCYFHCEGSPTDTVKTTFASYADRHRQSTCNGDLSSTDIRRICIDPYPIWTSYLLGSRYTANTDLPATSVRLCIRLGPTSRCG